MQKTIKISPDYSINFDKSVVINGSNEIPFSGKQKALLEAFYATRNTRVLSNDDISNILWPDADYTPDRLYEQIRDHISKIRTLIGDNKKKRIIQNRRGVGYIFCLDNDMQSEQPDNDNSSNGSYSPYFLAAMERAKTFDEIWVVAHDFNIDINENSQNPYDGVMQFNLERQIPYVYFVPMSISEDEVKKAVEYFNNNEHLTIIPFLPKGFDIPKKGCTLYNPNKTKENGRFCVKGAMYGHDGLLMQEHECDHIVSVLKHYMDKYLEHKSKGQ